ncbi:DUF2515 family protein [Robertmurraya sp. 2P01SA]|uniref:DUF2515 family protein n=1 Tax=Robertmurraya sp. 2P01SA TaxID=3132300 RepID=UPI0039A41153
MIFIAVKVFELSATERKIIHSIQDLVKRNNIDNIARTEAYFRYYQENKEIKWSFLAHMVSRNAGWNMCDLEGKWIPKVIDKHERDVLFHTYEKANWLIFQDAFPQLLLYQYSTKNKEAMFHLLPFFHVSKFMEQEWEYYWHSKDHVRILIALIINEQNMIQKPVIDNPFYRRSVFRTSLFSFQDWFHYSCVLLPTVHGELFGASVSGFRIVDKRIDLGKRLASILFHKNLYPYFYEFAKKTIHTGSRDDYEQYLHDYPRSKTTPLRRTFPIINHHDQRLKDWSKLKKIKPKWFSHTIHHRHPVCITKWFKGKQKTLHKAILVKEIFVRKFHFHKNKEEIVED